MKTVKIEMADDVFFKLARMAHGMDITFNELVRKILKECMKKEIKVSKK